MSAPAPLDRRDALAAGLVFLVAFALRWIFVHQLQAYPWFDDPPVDEGVHHRWALALAAGEPYAEAPFFRAPLYPWFLGALYRLLGSDLYAVRVAQGALGAADCALVYLAGRLAFRRAVGLGAGLAAAAYWVLLYFDTALLIPVLATFFHLLLLIGLLSTRRHPHPVVWMASGLALGLAAVARPNVLLFAPAACLWALWSARPRWGRGALRAAALTAGAVLPILPVTAYNWVAGGDLVLLATQGGVNFHIGNNPEADGISVSRPGEANTWEEWQVEYRARAEAAEGRALKPSEISRWYARRAWGFLLGSPSESLPLLARKALYFLSHREIPNNQDPHFVVEQYVPLVRWLPLGFWIAGPLGLLGAVLCARRREAFPLWGFVLFYGLSVVAFFVTSRFRVPVVPILLVLGAHAVDWLVARARAREWRPLAGAAALLAVVGVAVARVPPTVDTHGILPRRTMGLYLLGRQRYAEAEALLDEVVRRAGALGLAPDAATWAALGSARLRQGEVEEARRAFESALRRQPDSAPGHAGLAAVLERSDEPAAAARHLLAALAAERGYAGHCAAFAGRLARQGLVDEARAFLREAERRAPGDPALAAAAHSLRDS